METERRKKYPVRLSSLAPAGAPFLFAFFPRLAPWATFFRHSVADVSRPGPES